MANATESGDPALWPKILKHYREHPELRWITLQHLPCYWRDHPDLVVPLLREALQEQAPVILEPAVLAALRFPELRELAASRVKETLLDPENPSLLFEALGYESDTIEFALACLQDDEVRQGLPEDLMIAHLAYLLGLEDSPWDLEYYAPPVRQAVRRAVAERLRVWGLDLARFLPEEEAGDE